MVGVVCLLDGNHCADGGSVVVVVDGGGGSGGGGSAANGWLRL